jgi:hypothetical protein
MEDVRGKGEEVEEVSIGLDGDWFLRTDARQCTFLSQTPTAPSPRSHPVPITHSALWPIKLHKLTWRTRAQHAET